MLNSNEHMASCHNYRGSRSIVTVNYSAFALNDCSERLSNVSLLLQWLWPFPLDLFFLFFISSPFSIYCTFHTFNYIKRSISTIFIWTIIHLSYYTLRMEIYPVPQIHNKSELYICVHAYTCTTCERRVLIREAKDFDGIRRYSSSRLAARLHDDQAVSLVNIHQFVGRAP